MTEIWNAIPGYDGLYEASDLGRIRRTRTQGGRPIFRVLREGRNRGYAKFVLCYLNERRTYAAHRLIWEAFNGPIPNGMQINHKDGDKLNNRLSNLEVCTPSENTLHAFRVLKVPPKVNPQHGTKNGRAKLNETAIAEIRALRSEGWTQQKIANKFGVCSATISNVLLGKFWTRT